MLLPWTQKAHYAETLMMQDMSENIEEEEIPRVYSVECPAVRGLRSVCDCCKIGMK